MPTPEQYQQYQEELLHRLTVSLQVLESNTSVRAALEHRDTFEAYWRMYDDARWLCRVYEEFFVPSRAIRPYVARLARLRAATP